MPGVLYLVATPIGNLQDISPRVAKTFADASFIAAEDTRVTIKLLNHLGIKKSMISYHKYNSQQRETEILEKIEAGLSCALCSDAGLPAISDPGQELVQAAIARGIRVVPIPGANAALTALCASGQDTSRFVFEGFVSQNKHRRAQQLAALKTEERTMLFYEAPHKLLRSLKDFAVVFGGNRSLTICRELTKLHEEISKTTLQNAVELYSMKEPKGEFVLVLAGADKPEKEEGLSLSQAAHHALQLASQQKLPASAAAKQAAGLSNFTKTEIYKAMQADKK